MLENVGRRERSNVPVGPHQGTHGSRNGQGNGARRDHEGVGSLLDNAELAKADGSRAARNRSLELVGKELGMFGDVQPPPLPTKLEDLPSSILEQLLGQCEESDDDPPVQ
jgi:hypothetical protein